MTKKYFPILFSLFFLLLAACGQGTNTNGTEQATDGIETEENTDLTESEIVENGEDEEDSNEDGEEQTNEESDGRSDDSSEEGTNITAMTIELVFPDDQVMDMYRVEREIEGTEDELIFAAFDALFAGPTEEEEGLVTLIPEGVTVESVTEEDGVAYVSLSNEFLNAQVGSGPEAMLLQQIAFVMKQFGYDETQILIEGEVREELFGHIDTSVPIVAEDSFETFN